jgi:hypothetical protein
MAFKRLVRFVIGDAISFGDLLSDNGGTYTVRRLTGDIFTKLRPTEEIVQVDKAGLASNKLSFPFNDLPATVPSRSYSPHHPRGLELSEPRKRSQGMYST